MSNIIEKPIYNPYEERILNVLIFAYRPLTTNQVAKFTGISYNTTVNYLAKLHSNLKVVKKRESNRIFWRTN